jgi:hypothetical protein
MLETDRFPQSTVIVTITVTSSSPAMDREGLGTILPDGKTTFALVGTAVQRLAYNLLNELMREAEKKPLDT